MTIKNVVMAVIIGLTLMTSVPPVPAQAEESLTILEAVTSAIVNTPDIRLGSETVDYYQAQVVIDRSEEDVVLSADVSYDNAKAPLTPYYQSVYKKSAEDTQTLLTTISAEKTLHNGITLSSSVIQERKDDDLLDSPPDNTAAVWVAVTLPMAELMAHGLPGKPETNAQILVRASLLDLSATVAESARDAAAAFWVVLAEERILSLYQESEAEAEDFLQDMHLLVEKNEYPAAELDRIRADMDDRSVDRIIQEQALFAARQRLAIAMGAGAGELSNLPAILGTFPVLGQANPDPKSLAARAVEHRADLAAGRHRMAYYEMLVQDARNDFRPDIDLSFKAGYNGLHETDDALGYWDSLGENVSGLSYRVGITYRRSLGQQALTGALEQARVGLRKQRITLASLTARVASEVFTACARYRSQSLALERQKRAVDAFQSALDKETLKFKRQMGSLSDLLSARDRYRNSRISLVRRQQEQAIAMVWLRQACGALVSGTDGRFTVLEKDLVTPVTGNHVF